MGGVRARPARETRPERHRPISGRRPRPARKTRRSKGKTRRGSIRWESNRVENKWRTPLARRQMEALDCHEDAEWKVAPASARVTGSFFFHLPTNFFGSSLSFLLPSSPREKKSRLAAPPASKTTTTTTTTTATTTTQSIKKWKRKVWRASTVAADRRERAAVVRFQSAKMKQKKNLSDFNYKETIIKTCWKWKKKTKGKSIALSMTNESKTRAAAWRRPIGCRKKENKSTAKPSTTRLKRGSRVTTEVDSRSKLGKPSESRVQPSSKTGKNPFKIQ